MMGMKCKSLKFAVLFSAAMALTCAVTAFGAEFTTPDSVLTLETPGDDWKQIKDDETWATLSDGDDRITLMHYSNGEKLPEMAVAGDGYVQVCQNILSTENEVFIITGSVTDKENFEDVREAVQSVVINKYDTKKAVKTNASSINTAEPASSDKGTSSEASAAGQKSVQAADFTVWVSSQQLNIRKAGSTDAAILDTANYADALRVTGIEMANGTQTGWYQVDYNGVVGYVSSAYVTTAPDTAESLGHTLTQEQVTLYTADGQSATYVNKAVDGNWYDGSGRQYQSNGNGSWTCLTNGVSWTETAPQAPGSEDFSEVTVSDEEGYNSQTLSLGADGIWRNSAAGVYTDNGNGTWTGSNGTVWYSVN